METIIVEKKDGRVKSSADLLSVMMGLEDGKYKIIVKKSREQRTIAQNDLMWLWMQELERTFGQPKEDFYLYYCKKFLMRSVHLAKGILTRVYDTSSKLNTKQMSEFLTKIQADAATEFSVNLPSPSDRYFEEFYQTYVNNG